MSYHKMVRYCCAFNCKSEKLLGTKVKVLFCLSWFFHVKMVEKTMKDKKEHRSSGSDQSYFYDLNRKATI